MPVSDHLQSVDMRDFSGGLWTVNPNYMPANAAQIMQDCFPMAGGGLRAWFKPSTVTLSGIVSIANEQCEGVFASPATVAGAIDLYMMTYNSSDTKYRLYVLKASAPTAWVLLKTTGAGAHSVNACQFGVFFNIGDSNVYTIFTLPQGVGTGGTDPGTYAVKRADYSITKLTAHSSCMLCPFQNRILVSAPSSDPDGGASIYFSDPGLFTNIDVNKATTDNVGGTVGMAGHSPGDLLVFKGSSIDLLQGDLTNYTLRTMSTTRPNSNGGQTTAGTPDGVIWVSNNDGVWMTPDGAQIFPLARQISPGYFSGRTAVSFLERWFYAQGKLFLDYDSKAWFSSSFLDDAVFASCRDATNFNFYVATSGVNFTLYKYGVIDGSSPRAESFTWKSAPIRDPTGRQIEIRAVELFAITHNGATSTVTVTVDGVPVTVACDSSGRGGMTFYFMARREELDIQIVSASNQAGVEAPFIEVISPKTQPGHFLSGNTADAG